MASGRTVEAEWDDATGSAQAEIAALAGVDSVEVRGGPRIIIRANDSDAVARHLLTRTNAHDVTITSQNLEQAFLRLTGDDTEGGE